MATVEDEQNAPSAPKAAVIHELNIIPIASLDPLHPPLSTGAIKARVALLRPYSSSTRTAALLAAEPDFRLRRSKGQVWIHLKGPAARAVGASGVGINDTIQVTLRGSTWVDDDRAASTPGRGVDGALLFVTRLQLLIYRDDRLFVSLNVDQPESPPPAATPAQVPRVPVLATSSHYQQPAIWSSPAFLRQHNGLLSSALRPSLDPFADEEPDIDDRPKKRAKLWRTSDAWTYSQELPNLVQDVGEAPPARLSPVMDSTQAVTEPALTLDGDWQPTCEKTMLGDEQQHQVSVHTRPGSPLSSILSSIDASFPAPGQSSSIEQPLDGPTSSLGAKQLRSDSPEVHSTPNTVLQVGTANEEQVIQGVSPNDVPSIGLPVRASPGQVLSDNTTPREEQTKTSPTPPPIITSLDGTVEEVVPLLDKSTRPPLTPTLEPLDSAGLQLVSPFPASPVLQHAPSIASVLAHVQIPQNSDRLKASSTVASEEIENAIEFTPVVPVKVIDMTQESDEEVNEGVDYPDFGLDGNSFSRPAARQQPMEDGVDGVRPGKGRDEGVSEDREDHAGEAEDERLSEADGEQVSEPEDERVSEAEDERAGEAEDQSLNEAKNSGIWEVQDQRSVTNDGPSQSESYYTPRAEDTDAQRFEDGGHDLAAQIKILPGQHPSEVRRSILQTKSSPAQSTSTDMDAPQTPVQPATLYDFIPDVTSAVKPSPVRELVAENVADGIEIAAIAISLDRLSEEQVPEVTISMHPTEAYESLPAPSSPDSTFSDDAEADGDIISHKHVGEVEDEEYSALGSASQPLLLDDSSAHSVQAEISFLETLGAADHPQVGRLEGYTELAIQQSAKDSQDSNDSNSEHPSPVLLGTVAPRLGDIIGSDRDLISSGHDLEVPTSSLEGADTHEGDMYDSTSDLEHALRDQISSELEPRVNTLSGDDEPAVFMKLSKEDSVQQSLSRNATNVLTSANEDIGTDSLPVGDKIVFQTSSTPPDASQTLSSSTSMTAHLRERTDETQQPEVALPHEERGTASIPVATTDALGGDVQGPRAQISLRRPYEDTDQEALLGKSFPNDVGLMERETLHEFIGQSRRESSETIQPSSSVYRDEDGKLLLADFVSGTQPSYHDNEEFMSQEGLLVADLSPVTHVHDLGSHRPNSIAVDKQATAFTYKPTELVIAEEMDVHLTRTVDSASGSLPDGGVAPSESPAVSGIISKFFDQDTGIVEQPSLLTHQPYDMDPDQPPQKAKAKPRKPSNKEPIPALPARRTSMRRRASAVPEVLGAWFESRGESTSYIEDEDSMETPAKISTAEKQESMLSRSTKDTSFHDSTAQVREEALHELESTSDSRSAVRRSNDTDEDEDEAASFLQRGSMNELLERGTSTDIPASTTLPESAAKRGDKLDSDTLGLQTSLSYYHRLSSLDQLLNYSSLSGDNAVDVLAVVSSPTKRAKRATAGPKDFYTILHVIEPSMPETATEVHVFRPRKDVLPVADRGDVILLRNFNVKSRKRECYLLSGDASAWCVWRYEKADAREQDSRPVWAKDKQGDQPQPSEEMNGAPVELGIDEQIHARTLRFWWESTQSEKSTGVVDEGDAELPNASPRSARTKCYDAVANGE